jgi:hypothetical protein
MSSQTELPNPNANDHPATPAADSIPSPQRFPDIPAQDGQHPKSKPCRRNGNVARLPLSTRTKINLMLQDGVSYRKIIENLGDEGAGLNFSSLSRWKNGGHQDWLVEQTFIARTRARQESPAELVRDFDATEVNHAALQIGSLQMFEALRDLSPGSIDQKLGGNSTIFFRLINALSRASRETTLIQKYRSAFQQVKAGLGELKDPDRKLTQKEISAVVHRLDEILGFC